MTGEAGVDDGLNVTSPSTPRRVGGEASIPSRVALPCYASCPTRLPSAALPPSTSDTSSAIWNASPMACP